ncbi:hypothetical protein O0L34_g9743 [Tuta absoluta]|nr:hypothetical protein O0L34_g9743 [Tuta absoluta]
MFKSCCARPNKKITKSKSKSDKMDSSSDSDQSQQVNEMVENNSVAEQKVIESVVEHHEPSPKKMETTETVSPEEIKPSEKVADDTKTPENAASISNTDNVEDDEIKELNQDQNKVTFADTAEGDILDLDLPKRDLSKKRFSVDYKRSRLEFKRFSVDCRRDSATLEELARLEQELARTNVDVRPRVRRKSSGILKSTSGSTNDVREQRPVAKPESDDDEVFEASPAAVDGEPRDPPATPVGRDELALRRHRFFSDLVCAARAAVEHRVRFDPLGPVVADHGEGFF